MLFQRNLPGLADFFEIATKESNAAKLSANWIMGELSAELNKENLNIQDSKITAKQIGKLVLRIEDSTISGKIAKEIFEKMWTSGPKSTSFRRFL